MKARKVVHHRASAACATCGKKFYGPRRNSSLGAHKYSKHVKVKKGSVAQAALIRAPRNFNLPDLVLHREKLDRAIQALEALVA